MSGYLYCKLWIKGFTSPKDSYERHCNGVDWTHRRSPIPHQNKMDRTILVYLNWSVINKFSSWSVLLIGLVQNSSMVKLNISQKKNTRAVPWQPLSPRQKALHLLTRELGSYTKDLVQPHPVVAPLNHEFWMSVLNLPTANKNNV